MRQRGIQAKSSPHLKERHHFISTYVHFSSRVRTLLEDVAQREEGVKWTSSSVVHACVMLWRDAATPDRQMCSAHSFPIVWPQLTETRRGGDRFGKKEV